MRLHNKANWFITQCKSYVFTLNLCRRKWQERCRVIEEIDLKTRHFKQASTIWHFDLWMKMRLVGGSIFIAIRGIKGWMKLGNMWLFQYTYSRSLHLYLVSLRKYQETRGRGWRTGRYSKYLSFNNILSTLDGVEIERL